MTVQRLEHFLVISDDIDVTRDFYCDVLGMTVGFRPELDFPGYWLYLGEVPCLHVAEWETYAVWTEQVGIPMSTRADGTGPVDHIAFNADGYDALVARIESKGLGYSTNLLDDIGLRQIFIEDPNGVTLELNFRSHG
jgi:catechol 2,3-dioxygenase-like lactoylglutathione lyase family enzyme